MSDSNFFQFLIQFVHQFVIGEVRRTAVEAALQVVQLMHQLASEGLEKCVQILLLFGFADASLARKG
jgi:hypothetical protein